MKSISDGLPSACLQRPWIPPTRISNSSVPQVFVLHRNIGSAVEISFFIISVFKNIIQIRNGFIGCHNDHLVSRKNHGIAVRNVSFAMMDDGSNQHASS